MTPTKLQDAIQDQSRRHIVPLSGGKDSTALAVYMLDNHRDLPLEFVFTDTGAELPETYAYLKRFEAIFGVEVTRLTALGLPELNVRSKDGRRSPFDVILNEVYSGFLPNPQARWCTRMLKIKPFEHFVGDDLAYSYIGIRADEDRQGFLGSTSKKTGTDAKGAKPVVISHNENILPVYPLKDKGFELDDVRDILTASGLGLPSYYEWRSRSGCYFCFFQRVGEWQGLKERHPELFEAAKEYEKPKPNGRRFTWTQTRTLEELEAIRERRPGTSGEPLRGCAICHL